eukprot:TRINITY_DN2401_c0_g1_i2.p1 TRINITY_DN2401_c0_g1~~TRINITY_DN2401_c0_g1_i2.p1  ORF type:complete len:409 (+),score=72.80 TRINITY_DN2401_c0_g1_i2:128-1354(+)
MGFSHVFALCMTLLCCVLAQIPSQVRISATGDASELLVSWYTVSAPQADPTVQYGFSPDTLVFSNFSSESEPYSEPDWTGVVNRVVLSNLTASTQYYYRCGGGSTWSKLASFVTEALPSDQEPTRIVWFGDMGSTDSSDTIARVATLAQNHSTDLVIHVGDISYCDFNGEKQGNQTIWNTFMDEISPIAAHVPYMVSIGNHDKFYKSTPYLSTFAPPGNGKRTYYDFTYRNIYFLVFSTEQDILPLSEQHDWLSERLRHYHENLRATHPWLMLYAHRPIFCSNAWEWCSTDMGKPLLHLSIGSLLTKYNVDVFVAGHTHSYERSFPLDEAGKVVSSGQGTLHLVVGTPGASEGLDMQWQNPQPTWSAMRDSELGFGMMTVYNSTHLLWEFVRSVQGDVRDQTWFVKDR